MEDEISDLFVKRLIIVMVAMYNVLFAGNFIKKKL